MAAAERNRGILGVDHEVELLVLADILAGRLHVPVRICPDVPSMVRLQSEPLHRQHIDLHRHRSLHLLRLLGVLEVLGVLSLDGIALPEWLCKRRCCRHSPTGQGVLAPAVLQDLSHGHGLGRAVERVLQSVTDFLDAQQGPGNDAHDKGHETAIVQQHEGQDGHPNREKSGGVSGVVAGHCLGGQLLHRADILENLVDVPQRAVHAVHHSQVGLSL
mmetsp:Transcript_11230/g.29979  ORF Transcript_11230/g.29979 Transcript_11230/m.29979 type:complete len:217 (-) Transcript_11230:814-1464(-)